MENLLKSIVNGTIKDIITCSDEIFAEKVLGDGILIIPTSEYIKAPCDCTIQTVTETKHAITLYTNDKVGIIIHVGIDTVELEGKGFEILVKDGETVVEGQNLLKVDFEFIQNKGYDPSVLMIVLDNEVKVEKQNIDLKTEKQVPVLKITK